MRYLTIGLDGFDTANLFPLLTELKELRHLTLRQCIDSPKERLSDYRLHGEALLAFLAAPGSSLIAISLPADIGLGASTSSRLDETTQEKGIHLTLI